MYYQKIQGHKITRDEHVTVPQGITNQNTGPSSITRLTIQLVWAAHCVIDRQGPFDDHSINRLGAECATYH